MPVRTYTYISTVSLELPGAARPLFHIQATTTEKKRSVLENEIPMYRQLNTYTEEEKT